MRAHADTTGRQAKSIMHAIHIVSKFPMGVFGFEHQKRAKPCKKRRSQKPPSAVARRSRAGNPHATPMSKRGRMEAPCVNRDDVLDTVRAYLASASEDDVKRVCRDIAAMGKAHKLLMSAESAGGSGAGAGTGVGAGRKGNAEGNAVGAVAGLVHGGNTISEGSAATSRGRSRGTGANGQGLHESRAGTSVVALTSGFVRKINDTWKTASVESLGTPTLQVVDPRTILGRPCKHDPQRTESRTHRCELSDGGNVISAVFESQMKDAQWCRAVAGAVISVTAYSFNFMATMMVSGKSIPFNAVVMHVRDFDLVSKPDSPPAILCIAANGIPAGGAAIHQVDEPAVGRVVAAGPVQGACDGMQCSIAGIVFPACVVKLRKPPPWPQVTIGNGLFKCDGPKKDAPDEAKRFAHYWWFATNVYRTFGRGNRIRLPPCVLDWVRQQWPGTGLFKGHCDFGAEPDADGNFGEE